MSTLESILSQYDKNSAGETKKMSSEDRLKKYFTTFISGNERTAQRKIRILPTKDGSTPFKEVWFHEVQVDGKWVKLYDPGKNDNERSPLTEVYEELISSGNEDDRKLAMRFKPKLFYIVKVIDRDKEDEGVKFWRFKHHYKNEGVIDKIIPIFRAKGNIADPETGRDLIIQLVKSKGNNGNEYTAIQTIMQDDQSKISEDEKQGAAWIADELTWEDVYSKKPLEYLRAIAVGEVPKWDSVKGEYIYGDEIKLKESDETILVNSAPSSDEDEDEMPF